MLIEKELEPFQRLREFCREVNDLEITPQNWDFTARIGEVVRFAKARNNSFPFIFIDPKGWQPLAIEVIAPILRLEPGEVLINLMTSWIRRFLSDETKHFDRLLGSDLQRLRQLKGEEQEEELVRIYAGRVARAGNFKYVCTLPVLKSNQDAFHFHMIYATRHLIGVEVFKQTEKSVVPFMHDTRAKAQAKRRLAGSGQYSLLPPEAHYRERRFTEFQLRNLEIAKKELVEMLRGSPQVLYDDVWPRVMQHSAVMESDLREWLNDWKSTGSLRFTNLDPSQKLPRKHAQQYLEWIEK